MMPDDVDDIEHLFAGWTPRLECEMVTHSAGRFGCSATEAATYLIEDRHQVAHTGHPRHVICQSRQIWLRGNANTPLRCSDCGVTMTIGERFALLGLIAEQPLP